MKINIIILLICIPQIFFGQSKYIEIYNSFPDEIKNEVDGNSKNEIKEFLQSDSLCFANKGIVNSDFLKCFKRINYIDLSYNEINNLPKEIYNERMEYINLTNTNVSLCKIVEFYKKYSRGDFFIETFNSELIIESDKYPDEITVENPHFEWWNDLSYDEKIILENNADILIENLDNIKPIELKKILNILCLDVSNQGIDDIDFLYPLRNIVILNCENNKIENISVIENFENLGVLICNNNEIRGLDDFQNNNKLEVLIASNNKIEDISSFKNLECLEYLDVSNNIISEIDVLKNNVKLQFLNIAYNPIVDYSIVSDITNIEKIYFDNNKELLNILKKNSVKSESFTSKKKFFTYIGFSALLTTGAFLFSFTL